MSLRDRVPVEPLAPERWQRIEQRLVARVGEAVAAAEPPRRRRLWLPALALAGAAAAVAIAWPRPAAPPAPSLSVDADADGAHVDLGDAAIEATPGTRYTVTRPAGGVLVALATGAVTLEVPPRRGRPPLVVTAGDVAVRVIGTGFTVRRDPDVTVEVSHGVVEVERSGVALAVRAGERWALDGDGRAQVAPLPVVAASDPTPAAVPAPSEPSPGGRAAAAPPSPDAPAERRPRGRPDRHRADRAAPVAPTAVDPLRELRQALAAPRIPPAPPLPADERDPIAAFTRESIDGRGPSAASALWGLARTHWSRGRVSDALRALDAYQRRFPTGAERDAVSWLRLRILCERDLDDRCRAAAHSYAAQADDGPRRAVAVRVTQTR